MKIAADRHRRPVPSYTPGQKVWLSTKDLPLHVHTCKLAPRWHQLCLELPGGSVCYGNTVCSREFTRVEVGVYVVERPKDVGGRGAAIRGSDTRGLNGARNKPEGEYRYEMNIESEITKFKCLSASLTAPPSPEMGSLMRARLIFTEPDRDGLWAKKCVSQKSQPVAK
ncbi:hypothetical protein L3Q82_005049 [Scortum barcoo]|uniref:Uncharacterized protein n=1 Tax=Scortum barcoo TaxID=214431 RepID=A0ACB8VE78_9TELE|nr:hypothetical protein L3Q82_005049 [Scortum barcoo]